MTAVISDKKQWLILSGALIVVIIGLVLVVIMSGVFSQPSHQIPAQNITPVSSSDSHITPPSGSAGTLVPVTIEGSDFSYGVSPTIWLGKAGEPDIIAQDVMVISPTQLTCVFPLTGSSVSAGSWDVLASTLGSQTQTKLGVFTVLDEPAPPLEWNWTASSGWDGWQHSVSCSGTTGKSGGTCLEYGPVIISGHGEHGSNVTYNRVGTESHVSKTFTAPSGTRWRSLTLSGELSPTSLPNTRWISIDVNGVRVYHANATQSPPGNGQQFTIVQPFSPDNSVTIQISSGQNPTFRTSSYIMQFNSLVLR